MIPRMFRSIISSFVPLGIVATFAASLDAGDWPQWRGPRGDSVSDEKGLPVEWSEIKSVVWKTPLPEWGTSTPAIWGNAVFVTTHEEQNDGKLLLIKLDKRTGKVEWTRQIGAGEAIRKTPEGVSHRVRQKFHGLHNMASPSPVTDGKLVFAHFGNGDLAAFDFDGKQHWKRNLQDDHGEYTIWWGHANSPVIVGDLLISVCMQDSLEDLGLPTSPSYLVAHDKRTGEEKWKTMRMTNAKAEECDSYTTPIVYENAGRTELIVWGGDTVDAYDPATGKQLWFMPGHAVLRTITGPTVGHGKVYITRGKAGPILAVSTGGDGERRPDEIVWKHDKSTPDSCCPVIWNDLLFIISNNGIAQCLDAHTGEVHWLQRLPGEYKASPIAADRRVYFLNQSGVCTVVAASTKFEKRAENKIDDDTIASPAVSDGQIFLRGRKSLYCIGSSARRK
jgi:outer membrane protein assembly factor BamB